MNFKINLPPVVDEPSAKVAVAVPVSADEAVLEEIVPITDVESTAKDLSPEVGLEAKSIAEAEEPTGAEVIFAPRAVVLLPL